MFAIKAAIVHQNLKIQFYNQIKMNASITESKRTRKMPEVKVNKELLFYLNQIAGEYMDTNHPKPCAKLPGYSKQYSGATRKLHLSLSFYQINWKQSIENKISDLNNSIELSKKAKYSSNLSCIKIKAAKQII
ncbi:hypothetical protein TCON_1606 [Astathelohania contejeani]|uniref:Uncharacterized protein n=1 Tax=Astathelohania contejeani TaxID=164912 RepID=A0ABQ7HYA7_9MICR|nr:hypothetical protein TCON_1606 [Thelohania contejeani]